MSLSFEQALRIAGFWPKDVAPDGKWHRCATEDHPKKKNGSYKLSIDGRVGWYRNMAVEGSANVWREEGEVSARPIDWAAVERQRAKEREIRRQALAFAQRLWDSAARYSPHPYIVGKGLTAQGCAGLRVWHGEVRVGEQKIMDDWLLVPMYAGGRLVNVQRIGTQGLKRQIANCSQTGATYELTRPGAAITVLCEGLATGLAVYQSMRHARVVVVFYADNLIRVAEDAALFGPVVFAADNDHKTEAKGRGNPGIDKATKAAEAIGAGVAWPESIEGSDWADFLSEVGPSAAGRMERRLRASARYVMPP